MVKSDNFSAIFDSLYLLYYIVDHGIIGTFMRSRGMPEPIWYRVSYPYVLWPLKWMIMSCTIFLVVAISAERHRAICSPLTHRPTFWPYVLMVVCTACKWQPQSLIDGHIRSSLSNLLSSSAKRAKIAYFLSAHSVWKSPKMSHLNF